MRALEHAWPAEREKRHNNENINNKCLYNLKDLNDNIESENFKNEIIDYIKIYINNIFNELKNKIINQSKEKHKKGWIDNKPNKP